MLDVPKWVQQLADDGADWLKLQTGLPVSVHANGVSFPITERPLDRGAIVVALTRAGLGEHIPESDTAGTPHAVTIGGIPCSVTIAQHREQMQVRIEVATASEVAAPARSPTKHDGAPKPVQRDHTPFPVTQAKSVPARAAAVQRAPDPVRPRAPAPLPTAPPAKARVATSPPRIQPSEAIDVDPEFAELLTRAKKCHASDLHLSAGQPPALRMVGALKGEGRPLAASLLGVYLQPLLDEARNDAIARAGHADFAVEVKRVGRLRVNVSRQRGGLKACIRFVDRGPKTPAELGLPDEVAKITRYHQGLIVVAGPSGHGKTTTLASLVDLINAKKADHIITVEDPIEIQHPRKRAVVSQREVGTHTRSFQAALKGALREDPDVIVIGELRDKETVQMALSAAETGHIVLSTMSTPNGAKTIDRLIDLFPPDDQAQVRSTLAGGLKMIIAQRLVPSADGRRRHLAPELITGSMPLWSLIREDKLVQLPSLMQRGRGAGMIQVETSLSALLEAGDITEETARRYADDPKRLRPGASGGGTSGAAPPGDQSEAPPPDPKDNRAERSGLHDLVGKVFRRKN